MFWREGNGELDKGIGNEMQAGRLPVNERDNTADHALFLQLLDPAPGGRLAHAGLAGDFGNRKGGIALHDAQNTDVARL